MSVYIANERALLGPPVPVLYEARYAKCTTTTYDASNTDSWPVGADTTCKKVKGCPEIYPLIVCLIPGTSHASHDTLANPAFVQYLGLFTKAPFLAP